MLGPFSFLTNHRPNCSAPVVVAAMLGFAGCTDDPAPRGPDMSELVRKYDQPSGTFDQAAVDGLVSTIDDRLAHVVDAALVPLIEDLFKAFEEGLDPDPGDASPQGSVEIDGLRIGIEGRASAELIRTCDGWLQPPMADPKNGRIAINAGLDDEHFDPVLWGDVEACKYRTPDAQVQLDGVVASPTALAIHVGDAATLSNIAQQSFLVDLGLRGRFVGVNGEVTAELEFDFRVTPNPATFEVRIATTDGGDIIIAVTEGDVVRVRAQNGTFECDVDTGRCVSEFGEEVVLVP